MRLPNGFGSVYKLSGKRRRPWVARKTVGWKQIPEKKNSYPIYEVIGYYEKREQALEALISYNKDPYDLSATAITFEEVYEKWAVKKFGDLSDVEVGYKSAFELCAPIKKMNFIDVKLNHLQNIVDISGKNLPTLKKLKSLFNQLYDFAIMHEIISKDKKLTQYVDISKAGNPNARKRKPFAKCEIAALWRAATLNEYISDKLILIYTGLRISELLELEKINVNMKEQWFDVVESKTEAGIRKVPIADKIVPFFQFWMDKSDCSYLISSPKGEPFKYQNYYNNYWLPLMHEMNLKHSPHDTRHTCISLLTAAGVDERIIKQIVGHQGVGITQQVYTHIEIDELLEAINKI